MTDMAALLDPVARGIFAAALAEGRAGELLHALYEGGAATVDKHTGKLVIVTDDVIHQLGGGEHG